MSRREFAAAVFVALLETAAAHGQPAAAPRLLTPIDRAVVQGPDVLAVFTTAPGALVALRRDGPCSRAR